MSPREIPARDEPIPFALSVAASVMHSATALESLTASYLPPLQALGGERWQTGGERAGRPLVIFVATGGTERRILQLVQGEGHEPVLLLAHPGHNSLPAALEVLARLQQLGARGEIHYLDRPDDRDGLQRLAEAVHDLWVRHALFDSRIGLVGEPSDWLVASNPAPEIVKTSWGPTVVPIALDAILTEPDPAARTGGEAMAREFHAGAEAVEGPAEQGLAAAGVVYQLLRRVVEAERLDALAVRCFDLVTLRRTSGCLALAQLNDEGVIAGCEGDLVATVAMLWLHLMTGQIPWMANPSRIDPAYGTLTLAHCTVPRTLSQTYRLRSHFESDLGAGIQGIMPTGPVTVVRLGGARMERLQVIDGELMRNTDHADLCRTQVEVGVGRAWLQDLLARPLGNHLIMAMGHHAAMLRRWHEAMIT